MAEPSSCDRDYMADKPKVFTIWSFAEKFVSLRSVIILHLCVSYNNTQSGISHTTYPSIPYQLAAIFSPASRETTRLLLYVHRPFPN